MFAGSIPENLWIAIGVRPVLYDGLWPLGIGSSVMRPGNTLGEQIERIPCARVDQHMRVLAKASRVREIRYGAAGEHPPGIVWRKRIP